MATPTKEHTRAERLREHAALVDRARHALGALGLLVRGREARPREVALEVAFARTEVDGRALPAGVWVALRRDDVDAAVEAMAAVSEAHFLVEEREEMGEGYRLQTVQDTLPLPETGLLAAQLGALLDVPVDVLRVLADWGADDPRTAAEIDDLLTSRFGPPAQDDRVPEPEPATLVPDGQLSLSVADLAHVLRLDEAQLRALETLVRNAAVTITPR